MFDSRRKECLRFESLEKFTARFGRRRIVLVVSVTTYRLTPHLHVGIILHVCKADFSGRFPRKTCPDECRQMATRHGISVLLRPTVLSGASDRLPRDEEHNGELVRAKRSVLSCNEPASKAA